MTYSATAKTVKKINKERLEKKAVYSFFKYRREGIFLRI